jgi:protein TonB
LVDCENLPAAKLIFDVCRHGNNGNNPVPIAIVDGRAGLPTAFRLGAELILTKPVAKDQARTTIRTAVSRVRKDVPANETAPEQSANPAMPSAVTTSVVATSAVVTPEHARAVAAASSQLTSFSDPAPVAAPTDVPVVAPTSAPTATVSAPANMPKMRSAVDEDEIDTQPTAPKLDPPSTPSLAPPPSLPKSSSAPAVAADSKPAPPAKLFEDPVLAELEESELKSSRPDKAVPHRNTAESAAPVFSSYQQPQQKKRGPLAALLVLVIAGAALYAAWMVQPGFRALARLQIDRVLALVGIASPRQSPPPAPHPAKPSVQPVAAKSSAPVPESAADPNQRQSSGPDSAAAPTATSAAATPVQPLAASDTKVATPTSAATATPAPVVAKPEVGKPADSKKDAAAAPLSAAQLPGENSAIILSSKGAERRLAHSVQPNFPVEARGQAQGTVVLKEVVDQNGKVEGVRLVEGNAALATAAIQAVKQWRYRPYVRDGKAQPFQTIVIVDFQRP